MKLIKLSQRLKSGEKIQKTRLSGVYDGLRFRYVHMEIEGYIDAIKQLEADSDLLTGLIEMIADSTGVEIKGKFPGVWQVGVFNAKGEYSLFARSGCDIRSAIEAAIKKWSEKE